MERLKLDGNERSREHNLVKISTINMNTSNKSVVVTKQESLILYHVRYQFEDTLIATQVCTSTATNTAMFHSSASTNSGRVRHNFPVISRKFWTLL